MDEPSWSVRARGQIDGQQVVVVGIGVDQMVGFAVAGARLAGAISVVPAGGPRPVAFTLPVLALTAGTRDVLQLVVSGFAETLLAHCHEVVEFLDRVDPDGRAVVATYLPVPRAVLGGRPAWAQDAAVASCLEDKAGARKALTQAVSVVPSEPLPPDPDDQWWSDTCATLGCERLVVQAAGISGGGTGTKVCHSRSGLPVLLGARVMPYVDGITANVMGVVDGGGRTLVLPASRQLIRLEKGQPLYAGNVTGEVWATDARRAIESEVRALGTVLAAQGFVGPFGADFIVTDDGRRLYHDLNPRMNGVVDTLARVFDRPGQVPMVPLLLSCPHWSDAERLELEDSVHAVVSGRPLARLWLTRTARHTALISTVPPSGAWEVDPIGPSVRFYGEGEIGGRTAVLHTTLAPGHMVEGGDRLVLGNLFCEPQLAVALGDRGGPDLVDAFLA